MSPSRTHALALLAFLFASAATAQVSGVFLRTGDMKTARSDHTATLLSDGRVLITGGAGGDNRITDDAELYDPIAGSFTSAGVMTKARWAHTATLLADGKVLIVGGADSPAAELYDPVTGKFTATGALIENRVTHAAVLLSNGKVLIAGGELTIGFVPAGPELYDPATSTFSSAGNYAEPLRFLGFTMKANVLPDGKVLLTGENPPQIYDPVAGTFSTTGTMVEGVYHAGIEWHGSTSLTDGAVLITGGNDDETCGGFSTAEIYDWETGKFHVTGGMTSTRDIHASTLLRDGNVLLTGGGEGWCFSSVHDTAEVYDTERQVFVAVGRMTQARSGHTATLLNDGTVLIAGGFSYWPYTTIRTAERYWPMTPPPRRRIVGKR